VPQNHTALMVKLFPTMEAILKKILEVLHDSNRCGL